MVAPAVGLGTLRRLRELDTAGAALSLYLDAACLARTGELEHVLDGLLCEFAQSPGPSEQRSLREALAYLPSLAYATQGLALFSCAETGANALVPLPCAITPMAVIDSRSGLSRLPGCSAAAMWGPSSSTAARYDCFAARDACWSSSPHSPARSTRLRLAPVASACALAKRRRPAPRHRASNELPRYSSVLNSVGRSTSWCSLPMTRTALRR